MSTEENKSLMEFAKEGNKQSVKKTADQSKKAKKKVKNEDRRNIWLIVLSALLVVLSIVAFTPPSEKINLGLDIQGGLSVVLSAKNTDGSSVSAEDMETSRAIIENRVNALGASEATVQLQGSNQILVQIPGLSNTQEALNTIGKTGKLVFARLDTFTDEDVVEKIENGQYGANATYTDDLGYTWKLDTTQTLTVPEGTYTPLIDGSNISIVNIGKESDTSQYYAVNLTLDSEGSSAFAKATSDLVSTHGKIVIILDDKVQSAPAVQSIITGGNVSITGNYTLEEAQSLQTILQSGSLPVSFEYEQSQVVGPTLGRDALWSGVIVALIGLALVMIYLLFFYKGLGIITAAAMAVFAVLYLGILAFLSMLGQFSLSLAGVAGIVLTIGMAADSSVLTLERFREEIRMGRSIKAASISGVRHAILTSIDADSVTLVSALCLFFLASASVKGFGLTLALGIICDIIMMVIFKAPLIRLLAPCAIESNPRFWNVQDSFDAREGNVAKGRFIKKDINFLGFRKTFLTIAGVCMVLCFVIFGIRGLNFGIEFVGGSSVTFTNTGDVTTEEVRDAFAEAGEPEAVIQTTETNGEPGFLVRTTETDAEAASAVANEVAETFDWSTENLEAQTIGPDWGSSVIRASLIAFLVSIILIIIYIAIRFEYKMGVTAVIALLHDLILVAGIYALVGREITPNVIAALLTILGYSLYDTVVVFHRINDNMKEGSIKCTFMSMANHSINQVFIRTINTTLTSLIPVLFMLFFGGETLKDFAFAMVIGLIAGSYSSIAVATPLFALWKTREERYAKLVPKYGEAVQLFDYNHNPIVAGAEAAAVAEAPVAVAVAENAAPEAAAVAPASKNPAAPKEQKAPAQKLTTSQLRKQQKQRK